MSFGVHVSIEPKNQTKCFDLSRYTTMRNEDILELPVRDLMVERECLVAVWVTNRQVHQR